MALAGLLVLAAGWFAWSAWQQHQDGERRDGVTVARDGVVADITAALGRQQQRMAERVASAPVREAATDGDFARAASLLEEDWPAAVDAVLVEPELDAAYQALPEGGYGRLGAMEAALAADAPVAWVIRCGESERLAIAAPVRDGQGRLLGAAVGWGVRTGVSGRRDIAAPVRDGQGRLLAVALVQLPLDVLTGPVAGAEIRAGTYLSLRQGGHSVVERGDTRLPGSAEALSA